MERALARQCQLLVLSAIGCAPSLGDDSAAALADRCAGCHPMQAEEHRASRHARAGTSEVFRALREESGAAALCDACHRPSGKDGVGCLDCHAAAGNFAVKNGEMILDPFGPVRGPTGAVDPRAPHETRASPYLASADLCGTCHQVEGPGVFQESPYTHWSASGAPPCQSCHFPSRPPAPIADLPGLEPRVGRSHRAAGPDDHGEVAAVLYRRAARLRFVPGGLEIDNTDAGHHFPDGASFLRQLDLVVTSDGEETLRVNLAAQLVGWDRPARSRSVPAGEVARYAAEGDRACFERRRYRPELLASLGLDPALAGDAITFGCVTR